MTNEQLVEYNNWTKTPEGRHYEQLVLKYENTKVKVCAHTLMEVPEAVKEKIIYNHIDTDKYIAGVYTPKGGIFFFLGEQNGL